LATRNLVLGVGDRVKRTPEAAALLAVAPYQILLHEDDRDDQHGRAVQLPGQRVEQLPLLGPLDVGRFVVLVETGAKSLDELESRDNQIFGADVLISAVAILANVIRDLIGRSQNHSSRSLSRR